MNYTFYIDRYHTEIVCIYFSLKKFYYFISLIYIQCSAIASFSTDKKCDQFTSLNFMKIRNPVDIIHIIIFYHLNVSLK